MTPITLYLVGRTGEEAWASHGTLLFDDWSNAAEYAEDDGRQVFEINAYLDPSTVKFCEAAYWEEEVDSID